MRTWTTLARACAWLALTAPAVAGLGSTDGLAYTSHGDPVLGALIAETLARNPRIQQVAARHAAAQHGVRQATALPDPLLTFTRHVAPVETRLGPQINGLALRQNLPWFGKRTERGQVAAWGASAAKHDIDVVAAETVRQVKHGYFELGYLDRAVDIADEESHLLRHYESLARARYSQGVGFQQAVVKLQAEITRVMSRRQTFLRQRVEAESALNALRDRPAYVTVAKVTLVGRPALELAHDRLASLGREHRAEVRAANARIQAAESAVRLSRRAHWPDVVVGASWGEVEGRRDGAGLAQVPVDNGRDVFSVSLGVNIPIYRSALLAGTAAATAQVRAAERAHRETLRRVEQEVRTATSDLAVIDGQIDLLERALLPQAEQALSTTEEAYTTGAVGVLELLDSEEVLLDVRLGLARLHADYLQALGDLERAIGTALPQPKGGRP